jgi:hypothetical protein
MVTGDFCGNHFFFISPLSQCINLDLVHQIQGYRTQPGGMKMVAPALTEGYFQKFGK